MQYSGSQKKSSAGMSGQKLQPSGLGGSQTKPGLQPNVRSESGLSGTDRPVGIGHRVTWNRDVAVTVTPGAVTVAPG